MRNWALSLIALMVTVAPVAATPPQAVSVSDSLFARNNDTLFILRTVTDNHGFHTVQQTDTMVVFRSLLSGEDRSFQMVARVIDYGIDAEERVGEVPVADAINPYDLHSYFEAWPVSARDLPLPDDVTLDTQGLAFSDAGYGGQTGFILPLNELAGHITDTLRATRATAPLQRIGGGTTGPDPFDPALFDVLRDCTVSSVHFPYTFVNDPAFARISCGDLDETQAADLWVVVPRDTQ